MPKASDMPRLSPELEEQIANIEWEPPAELKAEAHPFAPMDVGVQDNEHERRLSDDGFEHDARVSPQDLLAVQAAGQNARLVRWVAASASVAVDPNESGDNDDDEDDDYREPKEEDEEKSQSDNQSSDNQIDMEEQSRNADSGTDYRRGRRYKKLMRVLGSQLMQRAKTKFRVHAIGVVVALTAAHVAVFAVMYMLLSSQAVGVTDLNNAGLAIRYAGEMGLTTRQLQQLYEPIPVSSPVKLVGMTDANDIPPLREWYRENLVKFKEKHSAFYLGADGSGRKVPDVNGLRQIWESPILPQIIVYAIPWNESIDFNTSNILLAQKASLWDIGNAIYASGNQIYTNAEWRIKNYGLVSDWFHFQYLMTNLPNILADNYYKTMDSMVDFVLSGARNVNSVQTTLLAVEGCVICSLAITYIWYLATKVAAQRFSIFSVFLAIPFGLVRNLATRKNDLGEDEEEDEDAAPTNQDGTQGASAPAEKVYGDAPGSKAGAISLFVKQTEATADNRSRNQKFLDAFKFWKWCFGGKPTAITSSKRQLISSYRQTLLLTWPFLLWGCTIIATYAIGVTQLAQISGPIATFNMVNFVAVRTHLFFFELQELVIEFNQTNMDLIRLRVGDRLRSLQKDYTAMMYGGAALPNETSPHFTLATLGLSYTGGKAAEVLFTTTACLCEDPKNCKEDPQGLYYDDTHNGLARLMNAFIKNSDAVTYMNGLDPWLFGPEFAWFWYVRFDVLGGLQQLNAYYQSYVVSVYGSVIQIHIAALVLTCLIMLGFLVLVLRPFINKTTYETRRVAELLSQLPPDVDVDALIVKALPQKGVAVPESASVPVIGMGNSSIPGRIDGGSSNPKQSMKRSTSGDSDNN